MSFCSVSRMAMIAAMTSARPGQASRNVQLVSRRPCAISQAATTAKNGLRNSLGCIDMPGKLSQRRAPLISAPLTNVSAVSTRAPAQPTSATRRTPRGDNNDTVNITAMAAHRNTTCLSRKMSREMRIACATAGLAAIIIT